MNRMLSACARALASLSRPAMLWHLLWPGLAAVALWLGLAVWYWADLTGAALGLLQGLPFGGDAVASGTLFGIGVAVLVHFLLAAVLLPLVYVTALLLVGVFALPLMLDKVADEYPDLERRQGGSLAGSLWNALFSTSLFLVLLVLSLPFWLVPGMVVLLPLLLAAWLNQRLYRYDALMIHADRDELERIGRECRAGLFAIGLGAGLLFWIPFANLLAPAFAGLASVHYCLGALKRSRGL